MGSEPPAKILFICLDAADKDLILQWINEGHLPALKSLRETSAWGLTRNPEAFYVGAVWPSFATGLEPLHHGRYCFKQIQPGSYKTPAFAPSDMKKEVFWSALSRAGKKIAAIDVPKTSLQKNLNGIQVVDWGTHDPDERFGTWPPELAAQIESKWGLDPLGRNCDHARSTGAAYTEFRDSLLKRSDMKAALSHELLGRGGWDCFIAAFTESHCVGHHCWHLLDAGHPAYPKDQAKKAGNPILEVYRNIDAHVGRLIEQAGPGACVFVLASHGMGPHYEATYFFDEILKRLENPASGRSLTAAIRRLWKWAVPKRLRGKLFGGLKRKINPGPGSRAYFQVPNNDVFGGVRVNLAGREPEGRIAPGGEYERVCADLIRDLGEFRNADNGAPVVRCVRHIRDIYPDIDLQTSIFPDLIVEWNRERPITSVVSPKTGKISGKYEGLRTGDHKPEGLFFAKGPTVRPGPVADGVSVCDFAPTIAGLLNVSLNECDGRSFADRIHLGF